LRHPRLLSLQGRQQRWQILARRAHRLRGNLATLDQYKSVAACGQPFLFSDIFQTSLFCANHFRNLKVATIKKATNAQAAFLREEHF